MEFSDLFRELMGNQTGTQFAATIGIERRQVCYLLAGRRNPGYRTIDGLVRAFPERREDILAAFLDREEKRS